MEEEGRKVGRGIKREKEGLKREKRIMEER